MKKIKNNKVKIMIVDDHPVVREGISKIIKKETEFFICGEASSAEEAIEKVKAEKPEIVIVDIFLEGNMNGMDLIKFR